MFESLEMSLGHILQAISALFHQMDEEDRRQDKMITFHWASAEPQNFFQLMVQ